MADVYAVVEAGRVLNLVVAEPDVAAAHGWILAPETVRIGDYYDNGFIQVVDRNSLTIPIMTFILLFTFEERTAIRNRADEDERIEDMLLMIDDLRATTIDLTLKPVRDAIGYLVTKGLLTDARAREILNAEIR